VTSQDLSQESLSLAPPILERLITLFKTVLPDSAVIVHGSLGLGDYQAGKSDVDLLVLSDAPTDSLVEAVESEWNREPTNLDVRVVGYRDAASPTPCPRMRLYVGVHDGRWEIERDAIEPDLVIEFSLCRQLGFAELIGPVPDEWVDEAGAAVLERWTKIGDDPPHHELMALTACRIWRFREERLHCSKPVAAEWARSKGAHVAYDGPTVRTLLTRAAG
jgi:predicted nucleotidyltransferase